MLSFYLNNQLQTFKQFTEKKEEVYFKLSIIYKLTQTIQLPKNETK